MTKEFSRNSFDGTATLTLTLILYLHMHCSERQRNHHHVKPHIVQRGSRRRGIHVRRNRQLRKRTSPPYESTIGQLEQHPTTEQQQHQQRAYPDDPEPPDGAEALRG